MHNIEQIDQNLAVEKSFVKDGLSFFDILNPPFKIYGVKYENGQFRRMPQSIAESVSLNVACLNRHTSGGRVRFKTNSKNIKRIKRCKSNLDNSGKCNRIHSIPFTI
jgi:hypothetical protein